MIIKNNKLYGYDMSYDKNTSGDLILDIQNNLLLQYTSN